MTPAFFPSFFSPPRVETRDGSGQTGNERPPKDPVRCGAGWLDGWLAG